MAVAKKRTIDREFTVNEIFGINMGLAFLVTIDVKQIGTETLWDVVEGVSTLKPIVDLISKMGEKINKDFYTEKDEKGNPMIPKELEEDFKKANEELENKKFKVSLPTFSKEKLQKLPGFTGRQALQLLPLIIS